MLAELSKCGYHKGKLSACGWDHYGVWRVASVWLLGNPHASQLSFLLVASVKTAQGKTGFIEKNTFLSKWEQGETLKGVRKLHEIVVPERGLRISQWRKARLQWRLKALIRDANKSKIRCLLNQWALWGRDFCHKMSGYGGVLVVILKIAGLLIPA